MIEIHAVKDYTEKEELLNKYNLEYEATNEILAVFDQGSILEFAVYNLNADINNILYVSDINNDFSLIHGLMKTLIFISDLKTATSLTLPLDYVRIAKAIGFKQKEDKFILMLEDYQNTCESSRKED